MAVTGNPKMTHSNPSYQEMTKSKIAVKISIAWDFTGGFGAF
jgi:hypothetical protein